MRDPTLLIIVLAVVPLLFGFGIYSGFQKDEFCKLFEQAAAGILLTVWAWCTGLIALALIALPFVLIAKLF